MFILLLLSVAASLSGGPQENAALGSLDSICGNIDNSYQCAQAIERHQLRQPHIARVAARAGAELRIRLHTGRTLRLRDSADKNDPSAILFSFRDWLEATGYFLIHRQLFEGRDYVLIHARSGKRFTLQELPVISPDGLRMVAASSGLSQAHTANAVQIWRVQSGGLELEFDLRPRDWEPTDPEWLDNRTIRLRKQAPLLGDTRAFSKTVHLTLAEKWTLEEAVSGERN